MSIRLPILRDSALDARDAVTLPGLLRNRRLTRKEEDAVIEVYIDDLEQTVAETIAARHLASNGRVVQKAWKTEEAFYDEAIEDVDNSAVLRRNLARRMTTLQGLNDDTIERYGR
jgi:hypothetical protein